MRGDLGDAFGVNFGDEPGGERLRDSVRDLGGNRLREGLLVNLDIFI